MGANSYVDELLMRARPLIQEMLEPVQLPEYSFKVSQSIVITDVEGKDQFLVKQITTSAIMKKKQRNCEKKKKKKQ